MVRLLWMDRLRGAAILAVIVMHAEISASAATGEALGGVHAINGLLAPYRMPMLVGLSGVLLTPGLRKPWRAYLSGKVRNLLWPYLVWVALDTAYAAARAGGIGWDYVARLAYDPRTYLWFLAYLFVFYLVALGLPGWLRIAGGPLLVLAVTPIDPGAEWYTFVWLLGWFLVGDTLGRAVRHRLRPAPVPRGDPLGFIGRHSLVMYVSHLMVIIAATDLAVRLGVRQPTALFLLAVGTSLAAGPALVWGRRHPGIDALFRWPSRVTVRDSRQDPPAPRSLQRSEQ